MICGAATVAVATFAPRVALSVAFTVTVIVEIASRFNQFAEFREASTAAAPLPAHVPSTNTNKATRVLVLIRLIGQILNLRPFGHIAAIHLATTFADGHRLRF